MRLHTAICLADFARCNKSSWILSRALASATHDSQESEEKSVAKHRFFHNSHEIDKLSGLF